MDRSLIPAPGAAPTTRGHAMTESESERLRKVEIWQGRHEQLCEDRHVAIGLRFDAARREIHAQLERQNGLRLVSTIVLAVIIVLVGIKQPAALFDFLMKIP